MTADVEQEVVRRRQARRRTASVLLLSAVLLAVGLLLGLPLLTAEPVLDEVQVPWWAAALVFAGAEFAVMNVQIKRQATTISLSEIPLVLCLFFGEPWQVVLGRVVGATLVYALHRRGSLLKNTMNATLLVAETVVAITVFRLVLGDGATDGPTAWLAAASAAGVEQVVAILAITRVIAVYDGWPSLGDLLREIRDQLVLTCMVVVVALVAVGSLVQDRRNAALLVAAGLVVFVGYRAYASLSDRHLSLERMYGFSQVVSGSPEVDEVLRSVLREAQQMLRAENAEVVVLPGNAAAAPVRVSMDAEGRVTRREVDSVVDDRWLEDVLVREGKPVLLPRGSREPAVRHQLERRGWREGILVPLRGGSGVFGTLSVADRMGEVRAFDDQDVLLLETVANHAGVAVQNGRLIDELRHEALHDALTSLPNRALFRQLLVAALEEVRRGGTRAAALVIDLDGFKDVNDTLGHAQGDELLREVAQRLSDAVGRNGTVARLGGDEFAVLLPDCGDEEDVLRVARRVLGSFSQPIDLEQQEVEVGASIGVALAPDHATDPTRLLRSADVAMYDAKGSTGGLRLFEPSLDATSERRLTLVSELRHALSNDELYVHVQPQADLITRRVGSVEALVRWEHPQLGRITPDEFIPVAERSGLIGPLTSLVLEHSLSAVATWRALGLDLSVAVNLSTRSLLDTELVAEVSRLLRRHDLPGSALTLEVTEGGVMADPARAVALLLELRELGVRLSVDDFGTGYSSLSYLKRLPVQEVKIDKSFVLDLSRNGDDAAIVRSIIDLGRHLGLEVVAEGVEDEATWQLLREMGCTLGQGWHLARPMAPEDLPGWLAQRAEHAPGLRVVV